MIGRDLAELEGPRGHRPAGATVLRLDHVGLHDEKGRRELLSISFEVRAGEILGVAGVAGNGQNPLFEAIAGLRRP
ncbi:MAG: hypothetical protein HC871_02650 [Rhizobiales bacterium]|nr:hypothetical protein [Hyphomicrobiales bacterium]